MEGRVTLRREVWKDGSEHFVWRDEKGHFAKAPSGEWTPPSFNKQNLTKLYEYTLYVKYPEIGKNREINWEYRFYAKQPLTHQAFINRAITVLSEQFNLAKTIPSCQLTVGVEEVKAPVQMLGQYIVYDKAEGRVLKSWNERKESA